MAESDPRGPASYSLSAGDHHFHKTSIVGTELQTPETHTGNNSYAHTYVSTHKKYIHDRDKTVLSLKPSNPAEIVFCWNKITGSPLKESYLTATKFSHRNTHTDTHARTLCIMWIPVTNNSPWVVG